MKFNSKGKWTYGEYQYIMYIIGKVYKYKDLKQARQIATQYIRLEQAPLRERAAFKSKLERRFGHLIDMEELLQEVQNDNANH